MTARKAVFGLCALCALLFSAVAAQGASAEVVKGTTAFTCKVGTSEDEAPQFADAHCKEKNAGGAYGHFTIPQGQTTEIIGTNTTTEGGTENAVLKSTTAGISVILTSTTVHGTGTMTNAVDPSKEHYASGTGTITYSNVTANHGCTVYEDKTNGEKGAENTIVTRTLTATTTGQGDSIKFTGEEQENGEKLFATFYLEGCEIGALNKTWSVWGSFNAKTEGATTRSTHNEVTEQGRMHVQSEAGAKAGLEGLLTISGRANNTQEYTPLSVTTVETE